jgi:hypothetical protein
LIIGDNVGDIDGEVVGIAEGDILGIADGDTLGTAEGDILGATDGDTLGAVEGDALGAAEGDTLGTVEGDVVGVQDGAADGPAVVLSVVLNELGAVEGTIVALSVEFNDVGADVVPFVVELSPTWFDVGNPIKLSKDASVDVIMDDNIQMNTMWMASIILFAIIVVEFHRGFLMLARCASAAFQCSNNV